MNVRVSAWFSGRVQGVGFRWTTHRISKDFAVTGFVRNLPDGRVELLAEGEKTEIERFIGNIFDRMHDFIDHVDQEFSDPTDEFREFEIKM